MTGLLSGLVSSFTQTETMLVSVERLEEYSCDLPQEPQGQPLKVDLYPNPRPELWDPRDS
jgi:ATP-binding cassette subfamily C (CFTR/MRP) protein 10